jgi:hypothetical protein
VTIQTRIPQEKRNTYTIEGSLKGNNPIRFVVLDRGATIFLHSRRPRSLEEVSRLLQDAFDRSVTSK